MYTLQISYEFSYAHRLMSSYTQACQNLHGHNGIVTIILSTKDSLNEDGMCLDFKRAKEIVRTVLDPYDHSTILCEKDPLVPVLEGKAGRLHVIDQNPTSEALAKIFCESLQDSFDEDWNDGVAVKVKSVAFQETSNNIATYIAE